MLKRVISIMLLVGLTSSAFAIDLSEPRSERDNQNEIAMALLYAPLPERIYDIRAMVMLSNTPDELAKYSNDQIKLKSIDFDEEKLELVYNFELSVPKSDDQDTNTVLDKYAQRIRNVMNKEDCTVLNFTHEDVANHYLIREAETKNILADFKTALHYCKHNVKIPYAH
jgi:hypothetical protein